MAEDIFEQASRLKLRFESPKGQLTVEDLWDLPLQSTRGAANLDDVARGLHKQLKNSDDDISFVTQSSKTDKTVQLRFDIVKHVIGVRVAENAARAETQARAEKKQHLLALIAERENDALKALPVEELRKQLEAL